MLELYLLETSAELPGLQSLAEETGWRLTPLARPTASAGVASTTSAGEEYSPDFVFLEAEVATGKPPRTIGRLLALDPNLRYWGFLPAEGSNARGELSLAVEQAAGLDRVWLPPSFLARAWESLVSVSSLRFPFSQFTYTWERQGWKSSEPGWPGPIPETGVPAVPPELQATGAGDTRLVWQEESRRVREAGGPLRADWPVPAALAAFSVWGEKGVIQLTQSGYLRASGPSYLPEVSFLIRAHSALTRLFEWLLHKAGSRNRSAARTREGEAAVGAQQEENRSRENSPHTASAQPNAPAQPDDEEEIEGIGEVRRRGLPLTILFSEPPAGEVLTAWLARLSEGGGALRLWGRGRRVAGERFQIRALDLHLRREVEIELSSRQVVLVWPPGACGNSLLRVATQVVHQIDPLARVFVGDRRYEEWLKEAWAAATTSWPGPP